MRRRPSSGSVPAAATPTSSPAGRVPARISVRRTSPAREDEGRCSRARRPVRGRTRTRAGPRAPPRDSHCLGARHQLSVAHRCVGTEACSGKTGERAESAAGAPRSARRRETLFHPEWPKSEDRLAPVRRSGAEHPREAMQTRRGRDSAPPPVALNRVCQGPRPANGEAEGVRLETSRSGPAASDRGTKAERQFGAFPGRRDPGPDKESRRIAGPPCAPWRGALPLFSRGQKRCLTTPTTGGSV